MPERWHRELRRLRSLDPPDRVWNRVLDGPRRDSIPSARQRIVAGAVALAVFAVAAAFAFETFRAGQEQPIGGGVESPDVTVTLLADGRPINPDLRVSLPAAELTVGGRSEIGAPLSYSWGDSIVDTFTPELDRYLRVESGSRVLIAGDAASVDGWIDTAGRYPFDRIYEIDIAGEPMLPVEPGRYVLELRASWPKGEVTFLFGLDVVASGVEPEPNDAEAEQPVEAAVGVLCDESGTHLEVSVVRPQSDGVHLEIQNPNGAAAISARSPNTSPPESGHVSELRTDSGGGGSLVMPLEPGRYLVSCVQKTDPIRVDTGDEQTLDVVHLDGVWFPDELSCRDEDRATADGGSVGENPPELIDQVVRHAIPGIRETDIVGPAGYPDVIRGALWNFRIEREGDVIALVRNVELGDRRLLLFEACATSGVGDRNQPTAGPLATPYELLDRPRCDPYAGACVEVFLTVRRYAELRGEDPAVYGLPLDSSYFVVLMTPSDGASFFERHDCGRSEVDVCGSGDRSVPFGLAQTAKRTWRMSPSRTW